MILPSKSMIDAEFHRDIGIKEWSDDVKDLIKMSNDKSLLESKEHIFFFQSYVIQMYTEIERLMTICVSTK